MDRIPDTYFERSILMSYILLIPIYSFFFLIGFKPFHIDLLLNVDINQLAFRSAIMASIEIVVTLISRLAMMLTNNRSPLSHNQFVMWEFIEALAIVMFCTLFIWLIGKRTQPYFSLLPNMFLISMSILLFPYIIVSLVAELNDRNMTIRQQAQEITESVSQQQDNIESPVHFRDIQNNLKLVVASNLILYIEAENNYVSIAYMNSEKLVKYQLRNTMKNIEEECVNNNLARCHRSFFINLRHVRLIKKESDGMFAELDHPGAMRIPISKTYSDRIIIKYADVNGVQDAF